MQRRKEEIRDIYQSRHPDFEKDFTPQVAEEILESRQRDLRRSRLLSTVIGTVATVLAVALVALVIRDLLHTRTIREKPVARDYGYIPRHTLPTDATWVIEYQRVAAQADTELNRDPGPKPLSSKWVKNAAYHIIMGQQALIVKETDQALEHFNRVVEMYPDMEGIHRAVGMLYLEREDFAKAAEHLEKALEEEELFDAVINLGTAYIGTEQYDRAEKHLLRALELQPENPATHRNLAILYRKKDDPDKAVYYFEKYLDLRPNDLETMQTYALYLTKLGRWKEAAEFLTELTQEVTDIAPIYFLLAQVQVQNGEEAKALEALQRGVQLMDPDMALAWMSRDEFNDVRDSGDFKKMVDELEIATVSLEDR